MTPSGCLFCRLPVDPKAPRCPAFALARVAAHAGCCGGCTTASPATGAAPVPAQPSRAAA